MEKDRIVDIEIKLTEQEDLLEALNKTVFRQQEKIDELEALCTALAGRLRDFQSSLPESDAANEKPPHY